MIFIPLGTKGQLIKMVGIIRELKGLTQDVKVINLGQHGQLLPDLASLFGIAFDSDNDAGGRDLGGKIEVALWLVRQILSNPPGTKGDLIVIHGDAPPALASLVWAKRQHSLIAHVEAGERTHQWMSPFPEELIRTLIDQHSDLLLACSNRACLNLKREKAKGEIVNLAASTLIDTVQLAVASQPSIPQPKDPYILAYLHRPETFWSRGRALQVVEIIEELSREVKVEFILHAPTRVALMRFGLLSRLTAASNTETVRFLDYFSFIHHLRNSEVLVTDGAAPQQESFYLGVPCLLLRGYTERPEHKNIVLCGLSKEKVMREFRTLRGTRFETHISNGTLVPSLSAAREIVRLHDGVEDLAR